jgi:hypothetical protein
MDMSVHPHSRVQGKGRSRSKGAAIAGMVTAACLIAVPVELLELGLASSGLSEILPVLAPPIGWAVRIALALIGAAIAAALAGGLGGKRDPVIKTDDRPGTKGNGIMGWTRSLGLHHLARLARGEDGVADHHATALDAQSLRAAGFRKREQAAVVDLLPRRRQDLHPDAPPRPPLVASRDLPVVTELTVVESQPDSAPPPVMPCVSPIRDRTGEVRPRPLPRAPAPLSDADLSWVRGLLAERDAQKASVAAPEATPRMPHPVPLTEIMIPPVAAPIGDSFEISEPGDSESSDSLLSLVDRFEQGIAQRIALRDAANAMERAEETFTGQPSPPAEDSPAEAPIAVEQDETLAVDDALNAALEALRKLSVKGPGR